MKITIDKEEMQQIINEYVEKNLGIKGEITIDENGITINTKASQILKPAEEVSVVESVVDAVTNPVQTVTDAYNKAKSMFN